MMTNSMIMNIKIWFVNLIMLFAMIHGRAINSEFRVKAVSLGGWLVTEGWMKPSLFDAIPNKDFLVSIITFTRNNYCVSLVSILRNSCLFLSVLYSMWDLSVKQTFSFLE